MKSLCIIIIITLIGVCISSSVILKRQSIINSKIDSINYSHDIRILRRAQDSVEIDYLLKSYRYMAHIADSLEKNIIDLTRQVKIDSILYNECRRPKITVLTDGAYN